MFCTQCGKEIPEGTRFCSYCGAPVMTKKEVPPQTAGASPVSGTQAAPSAGSGAAPETGAEMPSAPKADASFAGDTGSAAAGADMYRAPARRFCIHCGKEIPAGTAFCPYCGAQVMAGNGTPASVPAQTNVSGDLQINISQTYRAPANQLKTNKSLLKYVLLSLVTFGIYGIVIMTSVADDINIIASKYDNKKTMHYCLLFFLVSPLTLGIGSFVWNHRLANRMGNELRRRGIDYSISASDFWLWNVLGSLILVGPFVYIHKLLTATNKLCEHYNLYG